VFNEKGITELLMSPAKVSRLPNQQPLSGTRLLRDNLSDLHAQVCDESYSWLVILQVSANQKGIRLMQELIDMYGIDVVLAYMHHSMCWNYTIAHCLVRRNAAVAVRHVLSSVARRFDVSMDKRLVASDFLVLSLL